MDNLLEMAKQIAEQISQIESTDEKVQAINTVRRILHEVSPMKGEPVDFVQWVKKEHLSPNNYNPNKVAPPEMKLLRQSIVVDGYTQPVVAFRHPEHFEVTDGFHRWRVGSEYQDISRRIHGYLPVACINEVRPDMGESEKMASTIRHNRARGSHQIDLMVDIVAELKAAGMSDMWIIKNIGMDADELLRLKQISGLASLFSDHDFSSAWVKSEDEIEFYND